MSRRESRELAFKLLYQMEIQKEDSEEQKIQFIEDRNVKENEIEYFNLLFFGVSGCKTEIDNIYSQYLKKWNLDRIAKIDQTILRIATYEIIHVPMVPFNVSVSEAVFLAKKYSTDEARSFINGILSNLSYLKPHENAQDEENNMNELIIENNENKNSESENEKNVNIVNEFDNENAVNDLNKFKKDVDIKVEENKEIKEK